MFYTKIRNLSQHEFRHSKCLCITQLYSQPHCAITYDSFNHIKAIKAVACSKNKAFLSVAEHLSSVLHEEEKQDKVKNWLLEDKRMKVKSDERQLSGDGVRTGCFLAFGTRQV